MIAIIVTTIIAAGLLIKLADLAIKQELNRAGLNKRSFLYLKCNLISMLFLFFQLDLFFLYLIHPPPLYNNIYL